jgi:2-iminoacetate synthase ThiH
MLIDRLLKKHHPSAPFTAADWINTVKWIHRYGARSECRLSLSNLETWEDRLLHLQKIRSLQDENPGFSSLAFDFVSTKRRALDPESKLRAILLGRLFLDNVPVVRVDERELRSASSLIAVSLGGTDVELVFGRAAGAELGEQRNFLEGLSYLGMPLGWSDSPVMEEGPSPLH